MGCVQIPIQLGLSVFNFVFLVGMSDRGVGPSLALNLVESRSLNEPDRPSEERVAVGAGRGR